MPAALHSMTDFLGPEAARVLAEGRSEAFKRARPDLYSQPVAALARYSGQPYETQGVVDGLLDAMAHGLHVLIVSGGYGVLRAEEPIRDYEAPIQRTLSVWRSRIPIVLRDCVNRIGIARTFRHVFSAVCSCPPPLDGSLRGHLAFESGEGVPELPGGVGRGPQILVGHGDLDRPELRVDASEIGAI